MSRKLVPLARTGDVPEGEARVFEIQGEWIALCKIDGAFFAVEDRCTHDDGPLGEGTIDGHEIECPRHGACFDVRTGKITRMPARGPLRTFTVAVEGDVVFIELPEKSPDPQDP